MADENTKVKVWRRFEKRNKVGDVIKFRIQHVPEGKMDEVVQFMCINYIHEENLMSTAGVGKDPVSLREIETYLSNLPDQTLSIICCLDNEVTPEDITRNDIVAASMLYLSVKDTDPAIEIPKSEAGEKLLAMYLDVTQNETIYDIYKIDRYLSGAGLSVLPEYRGLGLAVELTHVRDEVCRAAGLKVNASFYTAIKSQNLASKCSYKAYYERDFAELGALVGLKFPDHTKMFKKMAKPKSEAGEKLLAMYLDVTQNETIYDIYKIDRYLSGAGLSVLPEYRGLGLAVELTHVRDEVCRAAGLKVNASFYTAIKSQNLASKCSYKAYYERDFAELGALVGLKFPDHTKMFKKMAKVVD